jgi:hypothetical protein
LRVRRVDVLRIFPENDASPDERHGDPPASNREASRIAVEKKKGRPKLYDWSTIEAALDGECRLQESVPRDDHTDKDWRTQADAIRYLHEYFQWGDDAPGDSTLKTEVGPMLKRIGERMKKASN